MVPSPCGGNVQSIRHKHKERTTRLSQFCETPLAVLLAVFHSHPFLLWLAHASLDIIGSSILRPILQSSLKNPGAITFGGYTDAKWKPWKEIKDRNQISCHCKSRCHMLQISADVKIKVKAGVCSSSRSVVAFKQEEERKPSQGRNPLGQGESDHQRISTGASQDRSCNKNSVHSTGGALEARERWSTQTSSCCLTKPCYCINTQAGPTEKIGLAFCLGHCTSA